jgi:cbb3-type cytochrome oxidase maturation protein
VRVTAAGKDTSLHRMADLVANAEAARTRYTTLADRAARAYAPTIPLLSLGAFIAWMYISGGDLRLSVNIAVATLIITCPCALGLAVPAVVTAASGKLFRKGLLIKDGTALERLAEVDTVVFDKTGTLTLGTPEPTNLDDHPEPAARGALGAGAGLEPSAGPGAGRRARRAACARRCWTTCRRCRATGSRGAGRAARPAGPRRLGRRRGARLHRGLPGGGRRDARLRLRRPAAARRRGAGRGAQGAGQACLLISGDVPAAVRDMAGRLGIDDWQAEALPQDKAARIAALHAAGHKVLMVGDGLNDTVALAGGACLDLARLGARCGARGLRHRASGPRHLAHRRRGAHGPAVDPAHPRELLAVGALQPRLRPDSAVGAVHAALGGGGHVALVDHRLAERAAAEIAAKEPSMDVLGILIPISLFLGLLGLAAFYWTLKKGMYDDPEGDSRRILRDDYDDHPKP